MLIPKQTPILTSLAKRAYDATASLAKFKTFEKLDPVGDWTIPGNCDAKRVIKAINENEVRIVKATIGTKKPLSALAADEADAVWHVVAVLAQCRAQAWALEAPGAA